MGLFEKKIASPALEEQVGALTVSVNELQRQFRNLELDYLQTYDKVKRLMSRVAKRASLDNPNDGPPGQEVQDKFSHLDPISAQIMRRRSNGVR